MWGKGGIQRREVEDRNTKGKKDESYFDHEAEFETSHIK